MQVDLRQLQSRDHRTLQILAADPALRAQFSHAARRRVLGRTWSALTDELLDHYEAVIDDAAPLARLAA